MIRSQQNFQTTGCSIRFEAEAVVAGFEDVAAMRQAVVLQHFCQSETDMKRDDNTASEENQTPLPFQQSYNPFGTGTAAARPINLCV